MAVQQRNFSIIPQFPHQLKLNSPVTLNDALMSDEVMTLDCSAVQPQTLKPSSNYAFSTSLHRENMD